jgi:hypothetical protein
MSEDSPISHLDQKTLSSVHSNVWVPILEQIPGKGLAIMARFLSLCKPLAHLPSWATATPSTTPYIKSKLSGILSIVFNTMALQPSPLNYPSAEASNV